MDDDLAVRKSRHIDIRYFYLKDLIKRGEITVQYCATENMVANFFTKPQGNLFNKLKAVIMGQASPQSLNTLNPPRWSQERVGSNDMERRTDRYRRTNEDQ